MYRRSSSRAGDPAPHGQPKDSIATPSAGAARQDWADLVSDIFPAAGPGPEPALQLLPDAPVASANNQERLTPAPDRVLSVLLIEDSPGDGALVRAVLRELNPSHSVTSVTRLSAGIDAARQGSFDLIISDLALPDSRGVATVTRLNADCLATPLIVLTGHPDDALGARAVAAGAQDYLCKHDLEANVLGRAIRYALERHRAHTKLQHLLRRSPDGVLVVAHDGTILFSNPAAASMLDCPLDELMGRRFDARIEADRETEIALPGGKYVNMRTVASDWDGREALVVALRDTTERRRTEQQLAHLAHYDQLTGLANRTLFRERLNRMLVHAERERRGFAVLALDLDRFKWVNDTLGHDAGDALLVEVAARLKNATREADTVARLGGDEFALIAEGVENADAARTVANKVITTFQLPFLVGTRALNVTTSVGIAIFPTDGNNAARLLVGADSAMYRAKRRGRNGYCFFDASSHEVAVEHERMEHELREGIASGELCVHYQPIHGPDGVVSVEALLRWRHPRRGLLMPDQFVPLLEQTGLIRDVGVWALETACEQLRSWRTGAFENLRVAVNVSPRQLVDDDFVASVGDILAQHGLPASALTLEVTESMLVNDSGRTQLSLETLHTAGVRISLDDFGTGYSSLAHLSRLPAIGAIKIDRSFVRGIGEQTKDSAIVAAIIGLAHNLELEVIAEGVERPRQLAFLQAQGCRMFQGYLLGEPRASEDWPAGGDSMLSALRKDGG